MFICWQGSFRPIIFQSLCKGVSQSYANYYKRAHQHSGHLWQGRFKSFHIDEDGYLLECGRYIERNPVRAKMVKDPAEWSWSSHRHYALGELNDVIDDHDLYLDLGETSEERQKTYGAYLLSERPYEALIDKQFDLLK